MKNKMIWLVLACSVIAGFALALLAYSFYYIEHVEVYGMTLIVGSHIGFDTDNETLAFGMIMPGSSSSTRFIYLNNNNNYPVQADFRLSGDIAEWVILEPDSIILSPGQNLTVPVSAKVPEWTEYGNYTGRMRITFKKMLWA